MPTMQEKFADIDALFGFEPPKTTSKFEELDNFLGLPPVEQAPSKVIEPEKVRRFKEFDHEFGLEPVKEPDAIDTLPVPQVQAPQFQPEVSTTTAVDVGGPQGELLPEFAPARALGKGVTLEPGKTTEEIPTRAPIPSTPLAGTAVGVAESIPFIGPEGADVEQIKEEQAGSVVAGQILGTTAQALAGGAGVAKVLAKTAVKKSPILMSALSRVIPATTLRGAQSVDEISKGKTEVKDALMNTIVESGGGAAFSMIPEIIMPPGVAQLIAQPLADVIYQAGVDKLKGEKGVLTKEWFVRQIPTIAASFAFAIKDVAGGKEFIKQQKAMREELGIKAKEIEVPPTDFLPKPPEKPIEVEKPPEKPVEAIKVEPTPEVTKVETAPKKLVPEPVEATVEESPVVSTKKAGTLEVEAKKYKSAEDFVKSKDLLYKGLPKKDWRTGKEIVEIDATKAGKKMAGFFTTNQKVAQKFADTIVKKGFGKVVEANVDIKNPFVVDAKGEKANKFMSDALDPKNNNKAIVNAIESKKYDGVIIKNTADEGDIIIPQKASQIKTKEQLTEIWNEAKKPKLTPEEKGFVEKVSPEVTVKKEVKKPEIKKPEKVKPVVEKEIKKPEVKPIEKDKPEQFETPQREGLLESEKGAVRLDLETRGNVVSGMKKFLKREFTTKGDLPEEVFREKIKKDAWVNAEIKDIENTVKRFRSEAKKGYKTKKLTDKQSFEIDAVLKGNEDISKLPENVRPLVKTMRNHIDALSQKMIDEGLVEGDLKAKVLENMGFYATRSYRVHDDPKWAEKVLPAVRNRAKAFIRQEASDFYNRKVEVTNDVIANLQSVKTQIEAKLKNPLSVEQKLNFEEKINELDTKIDELLTQKEDIGFDVEGEINDAAKSILDIRFGEQRISETDREFGFYQEKIDRLNKKIDDLAAGKRTKKIDETIKEHENKIAQFEEKIQRPLTGTQIDSYQKKLEKINSRIDKLVEKIPEFQRKSQPTEGELRGQINELLYKKEAPVSVLASGGKLGSKNLSILKRKKDIPVEIRSLWGEYKDADVNYAKSVSKMANLIASNRFLNEVKTKGKNKFFFDNPVVEGGKSYDVKISADKSPTMAPLNGLYTTKEIEEAFDSINKRDVPGTLYRLYLKVNSAAKYAKTIGSPMTHVRNVTGNVGFAIANGHFNLKEAPNAIKTTFQDLRGKSVGETKKYIRELTELGVISDGARAGEIRDIIKDATQGDLDVLIGTGPKHAYKKALKAIEKLYGAEDDVWKIFAYENELKRYKKALPDMPEKELKQKAANIVRDTYPTYSMIPSAIKKLRRFPLVGTFVSFPAEVVRTANNTIKLMASELKSSNPEIRKIGAQRLVGLTLAATITAGLGAASRFRTGTTKEKEDAAREFMAPWTKNSQIIWASSIENGKANYVDLGYSDPHSYLRKPLLAFLNGEDWKEKAFEAGAELLSPFLGEDMLAQKLLNIKRNKTPDGQNVYNPQDKLTNQTIDKLNHLIEGMEPGAIASLRRIYKSTKDVEGQYGSGYDTKTEVAAMGTGIRINVLDTKRSLRFKGWKFSRDIRDASRLARKRGVELSFEQKKKIYDRFEKTVQSARIVGLTDREIFKSLRDSGMSETNAIAFLKNSYESILKIGEKKAKLKEKLPKGIK
ncbi:MAG: hypothetical protein GY853_13895 [PVC group bacterium]|nr:hypothetical protein [PVC group bacterium]